jgi:hypothetical protein
MTGEEASMSWTLDGFLAETRARGAAHTARDEDHTITGYGAASAWYSGEQTDTTLWRTDRTFWGRVERCEHAPFCRECCWPYPPPDHRRGAMDQPSMSPVRYEGKAVARVAWQLYSGLRLTAKERVHMTCETHGCANPHHVRIQ